MAKKRKSSVLDIESSDGSDAFCADEIFFDNSSDGDDINDPSFEGLSDSNVSINWSAIFSVVLSYGFLSSFS